MAKEQEIQKTVELSIREQNYHNAVQSLAEANDLKQLFRLQSFTRILNSDPKKSELKEHPFVKGQGGKKVYYFPISYVEMTLDELFFGLWSTENFRTERHFNEIVGQIDLVWTHPITGEKMRRVGAGAIPIMQDKDVLKLDHVDGEVKKMPSTVQDFELTKKKRALDGAYPSLKSICLSNAAGSLGKIFGRDVNRDFEDQYRDFLDLERIDKVDLNKEPKKIEEKNS